MDFYLLQNLLLGFSFIAASIALVLIIKESLGGGSEHQIDEKERLFEEAVAKQGLFRNIEETNSHLEAGMDRALHSIAAQDIHSIKNTTQAFETSYTKELQDLNQILHKITSDAVTNTQKTYAEKLNSFLDQLIKTGLSTQTMVDKKTAELLSITDQEISEYKKRRMEKIDQEVKELIEKVYKDVLQSSISESMQRELIIKSLEEAKKDEMFKL